MQSTVGIIMLNTGFERLPGDIGNPASFASNVIYRIVDEAVTDNIVTPEAIPAELHQKFLQAAFELQSRGATVISTSCGFLSVLQDEVSTRLKVPFLSSSLLLLPTLTAVFGSTRHIGVLTFSAEALGSRHLNSDSIPAIEGLQKEDSLRRAITNDLPALDQDQAERETLACADRLLRQHPHTRAIILECTNLSPYKPSLRAHTGLPVFDIVDAIEWLLKSAAN